MSFFRKPEPTPAAPAAAPAPAAEPPVSRAEFSALDQKLGGLTDAIRELAQRPVIVQPSAPEPAAPVFTPISDAEIAAAFRQGEDHGAAKVRELVSQEVGQAVRTAGAEIGAVRDYGTSTLGTLAERTFFNGLDADDRALFKRYEKEVRGLAGQCEPALRGRPETWEACFTNVLGAHRKELENERIEATIRQREAEAAAAAAPQPGVRTPRAAAGVDSDDEIPSAMDLLGAEAASKHGISELDEADFLRMVNRGKPATKKYKTWEDYVRRGREIDAELAAIRSGETDNGDEPLPRSMRP